MTINQIQEICKLSGQKEFYMVGTKATLNCEWEDVHLGMFFIVGEKKDQLFLVKQFMFADDIDYQLGYSDQAQNYVK